MAVPPASGCTRYQARGHATQLLGLVAREWHRRNAAAAEVARSCEEVVENAVRLGRRRFGEAAAGLRRLRGAKPPPYERLRLPALLARKRHKVTSATPLEDAALTGAAGVVVLDDQRVGHGDRAAHERISLRRRKGGGAPRSRVIR
eukprot:scaffold76242_cov61-Phaeocystis_antarctica.AAC.2